MLAHVSMTNWSLWRTCSKEREKGSEVNFECVTSRILLTPSSKLQSWVTDAAPPASIRSDWKAPADGCFRLPSHDSAKRAVLALHAVRFRETRPPLLWPPSASTSSSWVNQLGTPLNLPKSFLLGRSPKNLSCSSPTFLSCLKMCVSVQTRSHQSSWRPQGKLHLLSFLLFLKIGH